jgi:hypothetical protein
VDPNDVKNLIAAFKCRDRISMIDIFDIRDRLFERLVTVLHEPLPLLTRFSLRSTSRLLSGLPETLLGGLAPRLRSFTLEEISFPSFPKFILCFPHIVSLFLERIQNDGYISPEAMVTCLAALPNLELFSIEFRSPPSHLPQLSPPHLTRASLPSLSHLTFSGVSEYFEDFVARIDTPRLIWLNVSFFMDFIFDIPRLRNSIGYMEGLEPFNEAMIVFSKHTVEVVLRRILLTLEIRQGWQLSSMARTKIFSQLLSHVERIQIYGDSWSIPEGDDDADSQWLELFRLLVAVQSLYVHEGLVSLIARALQDLTVQVATEVLPALQTLALQGLEPSGPVYEALMSFATARELSHHPVVIERW